MKKLLWGGTVFAGLPVIAAAQPVTGPYVSLGGGVNLQQNELVAPALPLNLKDKVIYTFHPGFAGKVSAGYALGNSLRAEIEGDYTSNVVRGAQGPLSAPQAAATFGDNPSRRAGGFEQKYGGFVNVLYDIGLGLPFQPYVGVGAGGLAIRHNGFNQSVEGQAPALLLPLPANSPRPGFHDQTVGGFAYQGIAGAAVPLPWIPGLSFTAEYHLIGLLDPLPAFQLNQRMGRVVPGTPPHLEQFVVTGNRHFSNDFNHEIVLGFRYALFQPPAPLPPQTPPPPMASPVPPAARTYLVFFDWDRADLTARARQIVAQAARASQSGTTQLQVDGYTDLSGTAAYNQRLSVRRAMSVKAELVRDGVPAGEIAIAGHGEKNPLVATAQGVREPQNRRVEIVLR